MQPSPPSRLSPPLICMSALLSDGFLHFRGHSTDYSPGSHDSELCSRDGRLLFPWVPLGESPGGLTPSWGWVRIHPWPEPCGAGICLQRTGAYTSVFLLPVDVSYKPCSGGAEL